MPVQNILEIEVLLVDPVIDGEIYGDDEADVYDNSSSGSSSNTGSDAWSKPVSSLGNNTVEQIEKLRQKYAKVEGSLSEFLGAFCT